MSSGRQSGLRPTGVGARGKRVLGLTAAIMVSFLLFLLAGCGGSSSSSPSSNGGNPSGGANDAFVQGRVIDSTSGLPLAGTIVQYGSVPAVSTDLSGNFKIQVGSRAGTINLFVTGSNNLSLYDYGTVSGTAYRIRTSGIPIRQLDAAETYNVGDISVFTGDTPPPPPIF